MFLNYLPGEMIQVLEITIVFSVLVGIILVVFFTSDQVNTKNFYLKRAK